MAEQQVTLIQSQSSSAAGLQIRTLTTADYKPAALALAEAFEHDEIARYFVDTPDHEHWTEKQKWNLHLALMEYITYAHCMTGLVTAVGDDCGAVALWMPPNAHMDSLYVLLRSGLWRLFYKLGPEGRRRMFKEFFPLLHSTKSDVLGPARDHDSYYLVYLGTRPSAQGKGYAKALVQHGTALADSKGVPVYLESSNAINVSYYGKFGFKAIKAIELSRGPKALELDIMVREPKDSKKIGLAGPEKQKTGAADTGEDHQTPQATVKVRLAAGDVATKKTTTLQQGPGFGEKIVPDLAAFAVVQNDGKRDSGVAA